MHECDCTICSRHVVTGGGIVRFRRVLTDKRVTVPDNCWRNGSGFCREKEVVPSNDETLVYYSPKNEP